MCIRDRVCILPPIPTTDWTKENLDQNVEMVRNLFLKELEQEDTTKRVKGNAASD